MTEKEFRAALAGIIRENRDHIPRVIIPQCNKCKHLREENRMVVCKAYPNGIPKEIIINEVDHKKPYKRDNGITFEPKEE